MARLNILVLFLILEEEHSVLTIKYNVNCGLSVGGLYQIKEVSFYFKFVSSFYYKLISCVLNSYSSSVEIVIC